MKMEAYPYTPTPIFKGVREDHEVKQFSTKHGKQKIRERSEPFVHFVRFMVNQNVQHTESNCLVNEPAR